MYILAIETTGAFASVALMKDDKIIGHIKGNDRFSHLQNLMPQVDTVIKENKLSIGDIEAIAVSCGPGSFTGIRIGVSSARALSQVLGIPCIAVSSLQALAFNAKPHLADEENILICPMLDARRSQVYAGGYLMKDGYPEEAVEAGPYMLDEFLDKIKDYERVFLLGDAVDISGDKIDTIRTEGIIKAEESIRYQDAASVAAIGARIYEQEGAVTYEQLKPQYMRLAEAERKLMQQKKG